jgi:hypothetical protein
MSVVRQYAGVVGVSLLLTGVLGLALGEGYLFNILNIDILEDIIHLATGGLMAYVGFAQRDNALARNVVGVLGVVYLLAGVLGFIFPNLFGLLQHSYTIFDNLLHLALGALGIVVGYLLPRSTTATT